MASAHHQAPLGSLESESRGDRSAEAEGDGFGVMPRWVG
jgi:hypothetical protein